MDFPKLQLGTKTRELHVKNTIQTQTVINQYDFAEKPIPDSEYILNKKYEGRLQKERMVHDHVIVEHNSNYYVVMTILKKGVIVHMVFDFKHLDKVLNIVDKKSAIRVKNNEVISKKHVLDKVKNSIVLKHYTVHEVITGSKIVNYKNNCFLDLREVNMEIFDKKKVVTNTDSQLEKIPEPYRKYYLDNRSKYVMWYPTRYGHMIVAKGFGSIEEKRFRNDNVKVLPTLMKRAEKYLIEEANKYSINEDLLVWDERDELSLEYERILMKSKFLLK